MTLSSHQQTSIHQNFSETVVYTPPDLSRHQDIAITRVRIGHTFLTHSLIISKDPPPIRN